MPVILSSMWPYLATSAFVLVLNTFAWKQPRWPGTRYFLQLLGVWLVWALAAALEAAAFSPSARFPFLALQSVCVLWITPLHLCFSIEYAGLGDWLTFRRRALLYLPALVFSLLTITNPLHNLVWTDYPFTQGLLEERSTLGWLMVFYNYACWLLSLGVLGWCLLRSPAFAIPILLLAVGQIVPRLAFLLVDPPPGLSPMQFAVLTSNFTALTYFLALFNFSLLRGIPVARDAALAHMAYAMIVLDSSQRVVDLNPAACSLPELPLGSSRLLQAWDTVPAYPPPGPAWRAHWAAPIYGRLAVLGRPAAQALGGWWPRLAPLVGPQPISQELFVGQGDGQQVFDVYSQPLQHAGGWRIGHVFVIHDITSAWRARRQLAQQQWAQATLQEREQLAHELHDGLSQNLAFLNLEAQAVQTYLQTGSLDAAQASLERLSAVSRQMQSETRQLIGSLLTVSLPAQGFCATIRQVLAAFERQSRLPAVLEIIGDEQALSDPAVLEPAAGVQLLRIVQEALANIRKHARHASLVTVCITLVDGQVQVVVADDGAGFEPTPLFGDAQPPAQAGTTGSDRRFGLQVMRQRADRLGGRLEIQSAPGQGTRVEVWVPCKQNL